MRSSPSKSREELSYYLPGISVKLGLARDDKAQLLFNMAIYQLSLYNEELLRLMHTHGVRAEGEVYTGCIRKYHKLHKRRQHDFSQDVRRRYGLIHGQHRRLFFFLVLELYEGYNLQDYHSTGDFRTTSSDQEELESDDEGAENSDSEGASEDFRSIMHQYLIADEDEELDKKVKWVEDVVLSTTITRHGDSNEFRLRRTAFSLAGAWYEATYNPDSQSENNLDPSFQLPLDCRRRDRPWFDGIIN